MTHVTVISLGFGRMVTKVCLHFCFALLSCVDCSNPSVARQCKRLTCFCRVIESLVTTWNSWWSETRKTLGLLVNGHGATCHFRLETRCRPVRDEQEWGIPCIYSLIITHNSLSQISRNPLSQGKIQWKEYKEDPSHVRHAVTHGLHPDRWSGLGMSPYF